VNVPGRCRTNRTRASPAFPPPENLGLPDRRRHRNLANPPRLLRRPGEGQYGRFAAIADAAGERIAFDGESGDARHLV
jgi:hypothetical protein